MLAETTPSACKLLNIAIVIEWPYCVPIVKTLWRKSSRLRLVAIAARSSECFYQAEGLGVQVFEDYRDLLTIDHLDLILELTGDDEILADLIKRRKPTVGVIDRQATQLLLDMAPDVTLESPLLATLMEASTDGVVVIDRDLRIINCNTSGYIPGSSNRNAILGKHCFEVVQRSSVPCESAIKCPAQETFATGKVALSEYEIEAPDKTVQICQVVAYPVFNILGEVTQCVLSIRDISKALSDKIDERTRAVKENLANVVREDRLASLGRLVASVCHEINNPITSIVTFTRLILTMMQRSMMSSDDIVKMQRYLDLAFREGMRCGSIVKNLLTFARPESLMAQRIDINEMVKTILILTDPQLERAEINRVVVMPPSFTIWGDFGRIQQCLLNLIFNAIDAMPEGGTMKISGGLEGDMAELSISDTGYGIEPDHLPKIFEPFFSTKPKGKGVGLGLSMVYGTIREHNGNIGVESTPGKGTTFTIRLPVHPEERRGCEKTAGGSVRTCSTV